MGAGDGGDGAVRGRRTEPDDAFERAVELRWAGPLTEAVAVAERGIASEEATRRRPAIRLRALLAVCSLDARHAAGEVAVDVLPERWTATDDAPFVHLARGRLLLAGGDPVAALPSLLAAGEAADGERAGRVFLPWRSFGAVAAARADDLTTADGLVEEAMDAADGDGRALGMALWAGGMVAGPDGVELLQQAVEVLRASDASVEVARALASSGRVLRLRDDLPSARTRLREAMEVAAEVGATRIAQLALAELVAAGGRPRWLPGTGVASLTPTERRVAEQLASGASIADIAEVQFVTRKAIEQHASSIYRKLGVSSREELVRRWRSAP